MSQDGWLCPRPVPQLPRPSPGPSPPGATSKQPFRIEKKRAPFSWRLLHSTGWLSFWSLPRRYPTPRKGSTSLRTSSGARDPSQPPPPASQGPPLLHRNREQHICGTPTPRGTPSDGQTVTPQLLNGHWTQRLGTRDPQRLTASPTTHPPHRLPHGNTVVTGSDRRGLRPDTRTACSVPPSLPWLVTVSAAPQLVPPLIGAPGSELPQLRLLWPGAPSLREDALGQPTLLLACPLHVPTCRPARGVLFLRGASTHLPSQPLDRSLSPRIQT